MIPVVVQFQKIPFDGNYGVGAYAGRPPLLMDRAYEDDETRQLVLSLGMIPVVPPKSNRIDPWDTTALSTKSASKSSGPSGDDGQ
jgi:hypothetical protein